MFLFWLFSWDLQTRKYRITNLIWLTLFFDVICSKSKTVCAKTNLEHTNKGGKYSSPVWRDHFVPYCTSSGPLLLLLSMYHILYLRCFVFLCRKETSGNIFSPLWKIQSLSWEVFYFWCGKLVSAGKSQVLKGKNRMTPSSCLKHAARQLCPSTASHPVTD